MSPPSTATATSPAPATVNGSNRLLDEDRPVHDWYRFVLSFPPHLVRQCLADLEVGPGARVLDPFCGTGTTLVECRRLGIASVGIEANPVAGFASIIKTDWACDSHRLAAAASGVAAMAGAVADVCVRRVLDPERQALLIRGSISPVPLHKALVLRDLLEQQWGGGHGLGHARLALAKVAVHAASNLRFGPEVGVGKVRDDAPVGASWLAAMEAVAADLIAVQQQPRHAAVQVRHGDARVAGDLLEPGSIDAVITSPPYPNEKDYTRATRLEAVLLGFLRTRTELRAVKRGLLRSNTRGVYSDDRDDALVASHREIRRLAQTIEDRRVALGKISGFERAYERVVRLYFGGMVRHLASLRRALKPGARLAYVVGDQESYFQVLIRTGQLLADLAGRLGYHVIKLEPFRTRAATATRGRLCEEILVLRWPG